MVAAGAEPVQRGNQHGPAHAAPPDGGRVGRGGQVHREQVVQAGLIVQAALAVLAALAAASTLAVQRALGARGAERGDGADRPARQFGTRLPQADPAAVRHHPRLSQSRGGCPGGVPGGQPHHPVAVVEQGAAHGGRVPGLPLTESPATGSPDIEPERRGQRDRISQQGQRLPGRPDLHGQPGAGGSRGHVDLVDDGDRGVDSRLAMSTPSSLPARTAPTGTPAASSWRSRWAAAA